MAGVATPSLPTTEAAGEAKPSIYEGLTLTIRFYQTVE